MSGISKRRHTFQSAAFLFHFFDTLYFAAGIFNVPFIIPCLDTDYIIIGIEGVIVIVNQDYPLALFFHFFQKEQYLCIVPANPGEILCHNDIYGT